MDPRDPPPPPPRTLDLHGLRPDQALRRVEQELHAARVQGLPSLTIVTGRGLGNRLQQPVLRGRVEAFLAREGPRLGVLGVQATSRGGALLVRLRPRA